MTRHASTIRTTPATAPLDRDACSTAERVTRSLLGWGAVAGPFYVAVSLAQALSREGFDLGRHQWSLLANGDLGWIQVANFALTGLMLLAAAVGLRRALEPGRGATWAPALMGGFGASMLTASVFRADPALGFPVGTPEGAAPVSTSGIVHFSAAGIGFACIAIACFAVARRYAADERRGWAAFSRVTGVAFLGGFACVASGGGSTLANLVFTATVLLVFGWITAVSADLYRQVAHRAAAARH